MKPKREAGRWRGGGREREREAREKGERETTGCEPLDFGRASPNTRRKGRGTLTSRARVFGASRRAGGGRAAAASTGTAARRTFCRLRNHLRCPLPAHRRRNRRSRRERQDGRGEARERHTVTSHSTSMHHPTGGNRNLNMNIHEGNLTSLARAFGASRRAGGGRAAATSTGTAARTTSCSTIPAESLEVSAHTSDGAQSSTRTENSRVTGCDCPPLRPCRFLPSNHFGVFVCVYMYMCVCVCVYVCMCVFVCPPSLSSRRRAGGGRGAAASTGMAARTTSCSTTPAETLLYRCVLNHNKYYYICTFKRT